MTVLVIDGPEKTGKSTTIKVITAELAHLGLATEYHHWGKVSDYTDYAEMLKAHTAKRDVIHIWDRSWASEYVYGKLRYREDHTMTYDDWIGAWMLDRAADANGLKVILLPNDVYEVARCRGPEDLVVPVLGEVFLYGDYAKSYNWDLHYIEHNNNSQYPVARQIALKLANRLHMVTDPTRVCGPIDSPVMFVGETKSTQYLRGGFLPFTSRYTTMFGREFGRKAIESRWTNITDLVPEDLQRVELVVLCGQKAYNKYHNDIGKEVSVRTISVPHPSYLYRYNTPEVRHAKDVALEFLHSELKEI